VEARCDACRVRLKVTSTPGCTRGREYRLWNKTSRCKVIGCPGRVTFWARDETGSDPVQLVGERRVVPRDPPWWGA